MIGKSTIRYSEAFKQQIIRELQEGRLGSCHEASRRYGIRGAGTVQGWLRQYGCEHLKRKVVRVETPQEHNELKELKDRVRRLERALSDATLDLRLEREYVKIACAHAGIADVEGFKKKAPGRPCTPRAEPVPGAGTAG